MTDKPIRTISFKGGLDISRYPEIHAGFDTPKSDVGPVIVDLTKVAWIDSVFMSELLLFLMRAENRDRTIVLVAQGNAARMLAIGGIDKKVPIVASYDVAIRYLEKSAAYKETLPEQRQRPKPTTSDNGV